MSTMFKVFVGNINFTTTEDDLRKLFEPHIEIADVVIARDPATGKSKGYGFVMTRDREKGAAAINKIGHAQIDGRAVYIKEAHGKKVKPKPRPRNRPPRRPRMRSQNPRSPGGFKPRESN